MYYKEIKIQNINLDKNPFSFSFPEFDQELFNSISNIGLITPPTLLPEKKGNKFLIVSGLKRILACKKLNIKILPCFILREEVQNHEKLILLNLRINLSHRELNDIEKANLLKLLSKAGFSQEKIIKKYMPEIKLEKSRKIYEDILSLNSLDSRSKMKIIAWQLPLKVSAALARYSKSDRDSVIKIAETLMPGRNRLKEIIVFLEEIALLKKSSITEITKQYLVNVVENSKSSRKERTEKIRQKLKELRYPRMTKLEKRWDECLKNLHLPPEIKITPPLSFEGKKIKLEISFSTKETLTRSLLKLNKTLKSDSLAELINLVV